MTLAERVARVRENIDAAVARRGVGPSVTMVAVSKRHPAAAVEDAAALGVTDFGENYAQELREKRALAWPDAIRWHFVGPLQRNKVKYVDHIALLHTVDRPRLLGALESRGREHGTPPVRVLIQVNIAGEAGKSGASVADVPALLDRFSDLDHVRCSGLMLIPPAASAEANRVHFRALRVLAQQLATVTRPGVGLADLSMGMSSDFEVAIEEGATLVRVGTALFGKRPTT